jgi:hypothetical protein
MSSLKEEASYLKSHRQGVIQEQKKKSESLEAPEAQEDPAAAISLIMKFTAFACGCIACKPVSNPPEGGLPVQRGSWLECYRHSTCA